MEGSENQPPYSVPRTSYEQTLFQPQTMNRLAWLSLALGIVAPALWLTNAFGVVVKIVFIGAFVGSFLAILFGHIAKGQISQSNGRQSGDGIAIAGIVIGWFGMVFTLLAGILAAVKTAIEDHCDGAYECLF